MARGLLGPSRRPVVSDQVEEGLRGSVLVSRVRLGQGCRAERVSARADAPRGRTCGSLATRRSPPWAGLTALWRVGARAGPQLLRRRPEQLGEGLPSRAFGLGAGLGFAHAGTGSRFERRAEDRRDDRPVEPCRRRCRHSPLRRFRTYQAAGVRSCRNRAVDGLESRWGARSGEDVLYVAAGLRGRRP